MRNKKIVHITQAAGGVKTYIEHIIRHADLQRFQFVIIAPPHTEFQQFCEEHGITYHVVNLQRSINFIRDSAVLFKIISLLKREKPDVIHTHSAKGGFLGRLAGRFVSVQVIYTPHAFSYLSFIGIKRIAFYLLEYIARQWTDLFLAVSHSEANRACFDLGFKKNKVKIFLNSIAVDGERVPRDYSTNFRIGMIGRLTYQKNPLLFLEIANRVTQSYPHVQFSILGSGLHDHLGNEIRAYLEENNLVNKVKILKWGNNETSKNFLNNTDVYVMTSVFEGLPYSLIEAMGEGLPCIVSKVDGNSDVIHNNENGFSCQSVEEFCAKIELLINDGCLRRKIGEAGYHYVKSKHDIRANISLLEEIYDDLSKGEM